MTQDQRHLRLILGDDLRPDPPSAREYGAWKTALGEAARRGPAPRVLIAAHGGLVSRAAGEAFAGHVRDLYAGHWTVTFVTRTGLEEALDRLTNTHLFSGLVAAASRLAALYRRASPGAFFPSGLPGQEAVLSREALPLDQTARAQEQRLLAHLGTLIRQESAGEDAGVQALARHWQAQPGELRAVVRNAARQAGVRLGARTWQAVQPQVDRLWAGLAAELSTEPFAGPAGRLSLTPAEFGAALATAAAAADPGALQAYVVEELIRTVFPPPRTLWQEMKDRVAALLAPGAVGTELLDVLNGLPPLQVSLLGHSLGGILLDHLERRAVALSPLRDRVARIVYLAPANTLALARQTPTLPRAGYALMGLTDAEERDEVGQIDPLLGGLYPRTVLYLISNALEDGRDTPILGMQRYLDADPLRRRFHTVVWVPTPQIPHFTHHGFLQTPAVRVWIRARLGVG